MFFRMICVKIQFVFSAHEKMKSVRSIDFAKGNLLTLEDINRIVRVWVPFHFLNDQDKKKMRKKQSKKKIYEFFARPKTSKAFSEKNLISMCFPEIVCSDSASKRRNKKNEPSHSNDGAENTNKNARKRKNRARFPGIHCEKRKSVRFFFQSSSLFSCGVFEKSLQIRHLVT